MNKEYALGIDIGGSHLAAAIVDVENGKILPETKKRVPMDSKEAALPILRTMVNCIRECLQKFGEPISGVGISVPGPFDYENGVSEIFNCNKYDSLFGVDIRTFLWSKLQDWINQPSDIVFTNDARCFLLGEAWSNSLNGSHVAAITLGTGVGSGFMVAGEVVSNGEHVPPNGEVYNLPFKGKRVEDWLGTEWFLSTYKNTFGQEIENVKKIAEQARSSEKAKSIFEEFGSNLGDFLAPLLTTFKVDHLIFGGNVTKSFELFKNSFERKFNGNLPEILIAPDAEDSAILGAVQRLITKTGGQQTKRLTNQYPMPIMDKTGKTKEGYEVFPAFRISQGEINRGFHSLAQEISKYRTLVIDGYLGVYWDEFITGLTKALNNIGHDSISFSTAAAFKGAYEVDKLIDPYLGGDDPVFGRLFPGELTAFFDMEKIARIEQDAECINILYGPGASLLNWDGKIIYVDVPKNEIQYRSRSGSVLNLGAKNTLSPKSQYKRMFFVDWPVLNRHKEHILRDMDYIVDGQYLDDISWSKGETLRSGLREMSQNAFRAKPWFEPGVWGGDWIKGNFEGLNQDVVNYAWSFELIVPENGVVFSDNGIRLEVSFDFLMFNDNKAILGNAATTFGTDFPIRFDYLDTFNGDNLSLQCHPTPAYIRNNFSEKFTQDETYYILDAEPEAKVYLGFKEGVKKKEFHNALINSNKEAKPMDVEKFIQAHPAKKHDLFLIPNGTIHCSGKNNLVLEISSTPYIYTFKMYDWMRLDLDGNPRPLNIARGMENVNFDCQGNKVVDEYISKETLLDKGEDWKILKLSTHPKHFYEVNRFEFKDKIEVKTNEQCHILNLVEGSSIKVITRGRSLIVQYAETFVVPSATNEYTLINLGDTQAKVIQSNVKPDFCDTEF